MLVVVELALQVAHGVGHEVFGVLAVNVIDRIVAVGAPVLGVHVAGVEAEHFELVVLCPGNDGRRVLLRQIAVGTDVLELLVGTFVRPPIILAAAQTTIQRDRQVLEVELLLQIQITAVLFVDGIGLGGADVVADVRVTIEVGRVAPVTASGLRDRPRVRILRRAIQRETDAGQPAVRALEEAFAVIAEVELGSGIARAERGLQRVALEFDLRRDRIGRGSGVAVRVLGSESRVGPAGIHDDVRGRRVRRGIGRCGRPEIQKRVLIEILDVVKRIGAAQRKHEFIRQLVVQAQIGGRAARHLRAGTPHDAVGHHTAVGEIGPISLDAVLLNVVGVIAGVEPDPQATVEQDVAVAELGRGIDRRMLLVVGEVYFRRRGVGGADAAHLQDNLAVGAIEGVLAAEIDLSSGRVRIHAGRERVVELDRFDAGDGHLLEGILAAGVVVGSGGGHAGSIHSEGGVLRVESADTHGGGVHLGVVERNAGHRFHELAHITHGQRAVVVGGDDVLGIHGGATFHDGTGLAFALRGNDYHVQVGCIDTCGVGGHSQFEIHRHHLARNDGGDRLRFLQTGVPDDDSDVTGRHTVEPEISAILGVGDDRRALDPDLGIAHVLTGCSIEDATAHAAAADLLLRLRTRGATAHRLQQDDVAFIGLDGQACSFQQQAQGLARIHLASDRRRIDAFQ